MSHVEHPCGAPTSRSAAAGGAGVAQAQVGAEAPEQQPVAVLLGRAPPVEPVGLLEPAVNHEGPVQHREAEPGHVQLTRLGGTAQPPAPTGASEHPDTPIAPTDPLQHL